MVLSASLSPCCSSCASRPCWRVVREEEMLASCLLGSRLREMARWRSRRESLRWSARRKSWWGVLFAMFDEYCWGLLFGNRWYTGLWLCFTNEVKVALRPGGGTGAVGCLQDELSGEGGSTLAARVDLAVLPMLRCSSSSCPSVLR